MQNENANAKANNESSFVRLWQARQGIPLLAVVSNGAGKEC
jgi:hypothetical protein